MKLKVNQNIKYSGKVFKQNTIVEIEGDSNDIPLDNFWRRRLIDSRIDNCVEVVKEAREKETKGELNLDKKKNNNKKNK